ncbi:MAG TPA: hypothetical protein DCE41_24240 [Cytophagales bacterium]|nr:hypothetical protein [Cytophagales bacterium]
MESLLQFRYMIERYAPLAESEWEAIAEKASLRFLKRNQPLISLGEACDKLWFVTKGLIRYYQVDRDLEERTTCFSWEGHFATPFSSYLKSTPSYEVLVALEQTEIVEIHREDITAFIETNPAVNSMYRQVLEEAFLQMEHLNFSLQHRTATERYNTLILEEAPELLQRVPLVHLASYLGISPETLSRVRAKISA